jgi:glycine cleavage system regulatory protein
MQSRQIIQFFAHFFKQQSIKNKQFVCCARLCPGAAHSAALTTATVKTKAHPESLDKDEPLSQILRALCQNLFMTMLLRAARVRASLTPLGLSAAN